MFSGYFIKKTGSEDFVKRFNNLLEELAGKKILIYGASEGFDFLTGKFPVLAQNISAIADEKFLKEGSFKNLKAIPPEKIKEQDFEAVLITDEQPEPVLDYLENTLEITDKNLQTVFSQTYKDEKVHLDYLGRLKFEKNLPKLIKKLKGKKVIIYGAGEFFEVVAHYYDLRGLNVIAISDRKFNYAPTDMYLGYKACTPDEIINLKPDCVILATKLYISIFGDLTNGLFKDSKIRVVPLVKKSFYELYKELDSISYY